MCILTILDTERPSCWALNILADADFDINLQSNCFIESKNFYRIFIAKESSKEKLTYQHEMDKLKVLTRLFILIYNLKYEIRMMDKSVRRVEEIMVDNFDLGYWSMSLELFLTKF